MAVIRNGYIARRTSKNVFRNWYLIKRTEYGGGVLDIGHVSLPHEYAGKKVKFKLELLEGTG